MLHGRNGVGATVSIGAIDWSIDPSIGVRTNPLVDSFHLSENKKFDVMLGRVIFGVNEVNDRAFEIDDPAGVGSYTTCGKMPGWSRVGFTLARREREACSACTAVRVSSTLWEPPTSSPPIPISSTSPSSSSQ